MSEIKTLNGKPIERPKKIRDRLFGLNLLVKHTPVRNIDWEMKLDQAKRDLALSEYVYGEDAE